MNRFATPATTWEIIEKIENDGSYFHITMTAMGESAVIVPNIGLEGINVEAGDDFALTVYPGGRAIIEIHGNKIAAKFIDNYWPKATPCVSTATVFDVTTKCDGKTYIKTLEQGEDMLIAPKEFADVLAKVRYKDELALAGIGGDFYLEIGAISVPVEYLDTSTL